jgi:hypothetical protein
MPVIRRPRGELTAARNGEKNSHPLAAQFRVEFEHAQYALAVRQGRERIARQQATAPETRSRQLSVR